MSSPPHTSHNTLHPHLELSLLTSHKQRLNRPRDLYIVFFFFFPMDASHTDVPHTPLSRLTHVFFSCFFFFFLLHPVKCGEIKGISNFHGSSFGGAAAHRLWHLRFTVEFMSCQVPPTDSRSLSVGRGGVRGAEGWGGVGGGADGEIPGETHSWEVIEFEGEKIEKHGVGGGGGGGVAQGEQWIWRKRLHHHLATGDADVPYPNSRFSLVSFEPSA